jgi:hypothetical protein
VHDAYGRTDPAAERAVEVADTADTIESAPPLNAYPTEPTGRSERPDTCPFLRAVDEGALTLPIEAPDAANRCVAVGPPAPQSAAQQQIVCLTASHANCPRYLRGALVPSEPVARTRVKRGPSPPVIASAITLVLAAAASVGFLLVRGGFTMPVASTAPNVAVAVTPPPASAGQAILPSPTPAASVTASPEPTPAPTPSATAAPTPTVAPTPAPTPRPTPAPTKAAAPTSNRYAALDPCPGKKGCWIYTVRRGDNLRSIANWFGIRYETVLDWNPQIHDPTTIRAGDQIRMPPPTR